MVRVFLPTAIVGHNLFGVKARRLASTTSMTILTLTLLTAVVEMEGVMQGRAIPVSISAGAAQHTCSRKGTRRKQSDACQEKTRVQ
jgi:hypothetical protein